ncbi:Uncharacterised protein [uncultured Clostridium sp.]|nr:Uncharacterised protein [uncultured Clostridium sp.]SCI92003.1 Uncharacterised protein [uncultured Clostridium sp.]
MKIMGIKIWKWLNLCYTYNNIGKWGILMKNIDLSKLSIVDDFNLINSLVAMTKVYKNIENKDIPRIEEYIQNKFTDKELLEIGLDIVKNKQNNMSYEDIEYIAKKKLNEYMDKKDAQREALKV